MSSNKLYIVWSQHNSISTQPNLSTELGTTQERCKIDPKYRVQIPCSNETGELCFDLSPLSTCTKCHVSIVPLICIYGMKQRNKEGVFLQIKKVGKTKEKISSPREPPPVFSPATMANGECNIRWLRPLPLLRNLRGLAASPDPNDQGLRKMVKITEMNGRESQCGGTAKVGYTQLQNSKFSTSWWEEYLKFKFEFWSKKGKKI